MSLGRKVGLRILVCLLILFLLPDDLKKTYVYFLCFTDLVRFLVALTALLGRLLRRVISYLSEISCETIENPYAPAKNPKS